jgi:hypothetical protein
MLSSVGEAGQLLWRRWAGGWRFCNVDHFPTVVSVAIYAPQQGLVKSGCATEVATRR